LVSEQGLYFIKLNRFRVSIKWQQILILLIVRGKPSTRGRRYSRVQMATNLTVGDFESSVEVYIAAQLGKSARYSRVRRLLGKKKESTSASRSAKTQCR
jgi:hypothetical protein